MSDLVTGDLWSAQREAVIGFVHDEHAGAARRVIFISKRSLSQLSPNQTVELGFLQARVGPAVIAHWLGHQ